MRYFAPVEARVSQGIVDDAAAICGALVAELRLRHDLVGGEAGAAHLVQAAVGGSLAARKAQRDESGRKLEDLVSRGLLSDGPGIERSVHLAQCPAEVSQAFDLGELTPQTLWCADVPLTVESESAGILRLLLDREPRRSMLRALRGIGHEASLQLAQERGRLRALADLSHARKNLAALAAASARLLRGAGDSALGILLAAPQGVEPDLGLLSSFALQASLALERSAMRDHMREQARLVDEAVEDRTRFLREANEQLQEADRRKDNFLA